MLLKGEHLVKSFGGTVAVDDVSFEVNEGEILAILGPNGAGKSVLFSLISGAGRPTSGSIKFAGDEIAGLNANRISRKGIARTFQLTSLFEKLQEKENLALGYYKCTTSGFWVSLFPSPQ